ncbi:hypothetical protein EYF80_012947 [Liparis tanakae]|uniref:Uncharacterized protein n=1 Tax=Liparis tanakae TaxID=230148 RepID=A0A4Z2IHF9_9TELE|nr:hypothetical protein EYF80_012947 [Liparis tanakae]
MDQCSVAPGIPRPSGADFGEEKEMHRAVAALAERRRTIFSHGPLASERKRAPEDGTGDQWSEIFRTPDALRHTLQLNNVRHPHTRAALMVHLQDRPSCELLVRGRSVKMGGDQDTKTNMCLHLTCKCLSDSANKGLESCSVRCKPSADRTQECLPLRTGLSLRASGGAWQQRLLPLIVMRACSRGIMETVVANEIYCLASDTRRLFEGSHCAGDRKHWVQR